MSSNTVAVVSFLDDFTEQGPHLISHLSFNMSVKSCLEKYIVLNCFPYTVEARYNEEPRDWQNLLYQCQIFRTFYYYRGKENSLLYRVLRYIEVPL